jgi:hypothetical protein
MVAVTQDTVVVVVVVVAMAVEVVTVVAVVVTAVTGREMVAGVTEVVQTIEVKVIQFIHLY